MCKRSLSLVEYFKYHVAMNALAVIFSAFDAVILNSRPIPLLTKAANVEAIRFLELRCCIYSMKKYSCSVLMGIFGQKTAVSILAKRS